MARAAETILAALLSRVPAPGAWAMPARTLPVRLPFASPDRAAAS